MNLEERMPINTPTSLEQLYYRNMFNLYFKNAHDIIPAFWMPRFVDAKDASARTLDIYKKKFNIDESEVVANE